MSVRRRSPGCTTAASPIDSYGACGCPEAHLWATNCALATGPSGPSRASPSHRGSARSRSRWCAGKHPPVPPSRSARATFRRRSSSFPSQLRFTTGRAGSMPGTKGGRQVSPTACSAEKLQELEDRERQAWSDYNDRIRELTGDEYERAEHESWERLQRELRSLERRRSSLAKLPG